LNAAGGGFFNEDRTACALNTEESLAGLDFQRSLYQDYDVATPYGEDPEPPFRAGKVAALGANIPSRVSQEALDAFLTFTPPDNNQAFLNGLADAAKPTAEGPLWAGSWPEYDKIMGPAIQSVLTGGQTVEEFGATICDEANKAFTQ
jgi:hypothetical protein